MEGKAAVWNEAGAVTTLGHVPGGTKSQGVAINDLGRIAGIAHSLDFPNGVAFLWRSGETMIPLGDLPGGEKRSRAFDLNDRDEVVGYSYTDDSVHAFLWSPSLGMVDLNNLANATERG